MKRVGLALVLMGVTTLARGQTSCAPVDPFGRMFAADIRPEVTRTNVPKFEASREAAFAFGSVRFRDTQSSDSGSAAFGYDASVRKHDFLVSGTYSRLLFAGGRNRDRGDVYGEIMLASLPIATISAVGALEYDSGTSLTYAVVLAAERDILPGTLKVGANLGWVVFDPKNGDTVRDFQPVVGVTFETAKVWAFSADYTFRNDVDGEDTGSLVIVREVPRLNTKIKVGAEKHHAYSVALTRVF